MNILEVKNLCKSYIVNGHQNNILENVNFNISKGEMVAIMGPSGSGKSTLLYSVSGLDSATSGEVKIGNKNIVKMTCYFCFANIRKYSRYRYGMFIRRKYQ